MSDETATTTEPTPAPTKKSRFTLPSAYTILFALIVLAAIATWFVPAGTYDLNEQGEPIPGTYHEVESHPARILVDSLTAPINGLYGIENKKGNINYYNSGTLFGAIDVALFIIVIGGFLGVTMKTGAIQAGIGRLVVRLRGKERLMIPILMIVFAIGGTTYGMAEESLAFYALVITVMIAAGYDAMTGAAIVLLGCGIGTLGSTINPFATGIASGFAGIQISDGLIGRLVILIVGLAIGIYFVLRYADRVKKDPAHSLVFDMKADNEAHFRAESEGGEIAVMTGKQKTILVVFGLAFVVMMYGVIPWEDLGVPIPTLWWWFPEMTASFLLFSIVIGLDRPDEGGGPDVDVRRRRARPARGRAHHRHRARDHRDHEQRRDHRHGPALGRGGAGRRRQGRVLDRDVRAVPAAVVPDPVLVRARDGGDADHGAAGGVRGRPGAAWS